MERRKLVFRRVRAAKAAAEREEKPFHPASGAMQGMIRIMPGVDLTQPADPELADYLDTKIRPGKAGAVNAAASVGHACGDLDIRQRPIAQPAIDTLAAAYGEGVASYVSPITAFEVGMLASRGRLQLLIRPERWFANLFEIPGVRLARNVIGPTDRVVVFAGQAAARSVRPHHHRDRARARRHFDHARPRAAGLRREGACEHGGVLNCRSRLVPAISLSDTTVPPKRDRGTSPVMTRSLGACAP